MAEERQMFVVWKRPDGFHGASPADFRVVEVGGESRIWLHKTDNQHFPFRIAGGWQEVEGTQRLNNLVNLLNRKSSDWVDWLVHSFDNSMAENPKTFLTAMTTWLHDLRGSLKGDTWEVEIMGQVLNEVERQLETARAAFLAKAAD